MSLLVDLLTKARTNDSKKDVPPGLRRTVVDGAFKKKSRRKVIVLSVLVIIVFLAGFATIYVMEMFKSSLVTTIATKTNSRQQPMPPASNRDERSPTAPQSDKTIRIAANTPTVFFTEPAPQGKIQSAEENNPRKTLTEPKDDKAISKPYPKLSPQLTERNGAVKLINTEKQQQKTDKDVYLYAARTYETKGEFKQAIELYMKALELDPGNYIVMNNIAGVLIRVGSYNEALSYAKNALNVKTNYVPSLINAGIAYVSLGNLTEGEGFLARATTIEPLNRVALYNLAVLSEKQANFDKAYESYYRLSQMRDVDGCLGAARIMEKKGQNFDAARFYREILSIENASSSTKQFANQRLSQLTR